MWIHDTDERRDVELQDRHQALEVAEILKSAVDESLELVAHRREEGRQQERADHDRGVGALARHSCERTLHQCHRAGIKACPDGGQRDIDNRAVEDEIDVGEPAAVPSPIRSPMTWRTSAAADA